eukprot:TRINITY_DN1347_c0_g1_i1.p1 TRINITY_DN1347_c0_g1~~TRINITY_DN1347_c0_g1_i1.p1  ORF type:complete len:184 (-),score=45.44 TRINITY_DN1347_c0_g1_i1:25-534(-)
MFRFSAQRVGYLAVHGVVVGGACTMLQERYGLVAAAEDGSADRKKTGFGEVPNAAELGKLIGPLSAQLGFGGVAGFAAGFALKKAAKVTLLVTGSGVVALQLLAQAGVLTVDWRRVEELLHARLDQTGDAKFDQDDASKLTQRAVKALENGFVATGGFGGGLLLGLKRG